MLKLIRMTASYAAACPFCVDMNSTSIVTWESRRGSRIPARRFRAGEYLFRARETGNCYTRVISQTPLKFHPDLVERVKSAFTEREFVILASTAAQVNYWAD